MTDDSCADGTERSLVTELASETMDWMAEDRSREDVTNEAWAMSLATFVDGVAISPMGHDVSDVFGPRYCVWCKGRITDEPAGSNVCRDCFYGINSSTYQRKASWVTRFINRLRRFVSAGTKQEVDR